jgi:O-antigen/teichoic acid export membrane protein
MRAAAVRYQRFAQYALPADLLSTLASQSPLLFLDDVAGGLYAFVQLVLGAPISVVSGSVLDAFKDRAARDYREKGNFADIFDKIARTLVLVSAGPTLLLLTLGPPIFGLVFGADWQEAGLFAQLLAVMYFLKLFVSPLSYSYFIVERQREDFVLHVLVLAGTVGGLWLGIRYFDSGRVAVALYSAVYSAAYVLYFFRSRSFSRGVARA